jgi:hypothetical protein
LASLPDELRAKAQGPFDDPARTAWNYQPVPRFGLMRKEMSAAQRQAADALLASFLSASGMETVRRIRTLEDDLREMENGNPSRDAGLYGTAIFGTPGPKGTWAFRYEGHHLSLNWTLRDGKIVSSTPQFLGANPADVRSGKRAGWRVLGAMEDQGRALLESLDGAQRQKAILDPKSPSGVLPGYEPRAERPAEGGLAWNEMTPAQHRLVRQLLSEYANILRKPRVIDPKALRFGWKGGQKKGEDHYYRFLGPTELIEYVNNQNGANHIHTVVRDFGGDFGG